MSNESQSSRTLVVVPTYNEADNIRRAVSQILSHCPQVSVLIVDDASPDGTGTIADDLAKERPAVHVLHRTGERGLSRAYVDGFRWGMDHGFDYFVEMDADGSHRAEDLPVLLEEAQHFDLVIGSRWIEGGHVQNWPWHRHVLSRAANLYVRAMLGMGVHDATAGFRVFRRRALEESDFSSIQSRGYSFQIELTRRAIRRGLSVKEVPILFVERAEGHSKMTYGIIVESFARVASWAYADRVASKLHRQERSKA